MIFWKKVIRHALFILLLTGLAGSFPNSMKGQLVQGSVSLACGEAILTDGSVRIETPKGRKPLRVFENAYSSRQRVLHKIEGSKVDSVTIWSVTSPGRAHVLKFIQGYGWCVSLEKGKLIEVLCFSPKGYYIGGNGGISFRKKPQIIIKKGDERFEFGDLSKMADKRFRDRVSEIVADDPDLSCSIMDAESRRDRILRSLSNYSPKKIEK